MEGRREPDELELCREAEMLDIEEELRDLLKPTSSG
jgi:hypothetical protein